MAEFYRFRSIDSLLGKHRELEEQTIYFASPEELNDPMEGLRDIVWNGDKIAWTNFFKHYVFCLNRSFLLLNITLKSRKLDVADIPILELWDGILIPIEKSLFDDVWDRFCNLPYIQEIIEVLANTGRKIRDREIVAYIQMIQALVLLDEIQKIYIRYGTICKFQIWQPRLDTVVAMEKVLDFIKTVELVENEQQLDDLLQVDEALHDDMQFAVEYNTRTHPPEILDRINRMTMPDFPKVYVEQLDRLLWTDWYTACFTESYCNSSVWAKYADGHKGVCLIFKSIEKDDSNNLELNNNSITLPFRKVHYEDKPSETDFFRTICRMPMGTLRELWYTDQDGNISECATHIESDQSRTDWREDYRKNFFRYTTTKTKDWKYEQEYRLVLDDGLGQFNEKGDRPLTYDFSSLKGIIFGIRTPTEDKVKIREIIEEKKKCSENKQTDFKYFQAYYSANDGKIHKREIRL